MRRLTLVFLSVLLVLSLVGCASRTYNSKSDYLDGTVLVEYFQTRQSGSDDSVTFTFYDTGTYTVEFSYTEGKEDRAKLPENFTYTVEEAPRVKVVSQYVLPGFLNIKITHNDATESHDFK